MRVLILSLREAICATLLVASACSQGLGDPSSAAQITKARIVSRIADTGTADDTPKRALAADGVTMYAAIDAGGTWYCDTTPIRIGGKKIDAQPIASAPAFAIAWRKIEPTSVDLSNDQPDGSFSYTPIDYATTDLASGVAELDADVHPTLTPDHGDGVGTMRYQIEVSAGGDAVDSPGTEARRGGASGGLTDAVTRITLRRDDTYLGFLTELYGQPYIWASAGRSDATHQSERLEGADCADFVVYGRRRMGHAVPYTWTGGLPSYTKRLAAGTPSDDGVYRDDAGKPVPFTQVGDLILFPRHVGVLAEDHGTIGVLDEDDVIMHALFDSPKQVRIADSGYGDKPIELRRWKK